MKPLGELPDHVLGFGLWTLQSCAFALPLLLCFPFLLLRTSWKLWKLGPEGAGGCGEEEEGGGGRGGEAESLKWRAIAF